MIAWDSLGKYFPPGYEYEKERNGAALLLGLGIVPSFSFFRRLYAAWDALYCYDRRDGRKLMPGAVADSFWELAAEYLWLFLPFFLFLAAMVVRHYLYYSRDTKSIYLMRRLPDKKILRGTCAQAPLLGMTVGIAAIIILFLIYYGIYILAIPAACAPRFW